jgi:predicted 3-demethylubiquinone-9 3-methyltransferase (glyoxalase superfamily)
MANIQKVTPFLWFDKNCEEAVNYYVGVFKNSKIIDIARYPEDMQIGPVPDMGGKVLTAVFELDGTQFMALDGGPYFKISEAVSFLISCQDQEEIDYFWSKLSHVPASEQCGWCKDKFGVSWQIVPADMSDLMQGNKDAMSKMLQMKKIIIADLK